MSDQIQVNPGDSLPNVIRRKIANEILEGIISPGTKLDEKSLTERFNVSRTPIREALRQLQSAHLVEIKPHKGAIVIAPDRQHLENLFETASELKGLSAKFAAARMTMIERKRIVEIHKKCIALVNTGNGENVIEEFASLIRQLQSVLLDGMHNPVFSTVVNQILIQLAPYNKSQLEIEGRLKAYTQEYGKVIEAIIAQDFNGAYETMKTHVTEVYYAALNCIDTD